jgi:hypothetical protein
MEKLIELLADIDISKNDGYIFVKKDEIIVPIVKTILSVTKRSYFALPLLDEIILRLANEGMYEIDNLVKILGINRKLLEVTLADLSVKNIIYCTSNRITLLEKGKEALKELRTIQRKKDTIKNVYLDPINKKVIADYEKYQFIDNAYDNDKKLDADFEIDNLNIFNENIDVIKAIFEDEMNIYNDKTKSEPDELLSIDNIERAFIKFVRIPIHIYVSTTGYDIDILPVNKKYNELLQQFKNEIIDQIRRRKVLKYTFVRNAKKFECVKPALKEIPEIQDLLALYKKNRKNSDILDILEQKIFSSRKLFDEEFEVLINYYVKESEKIEISVTCLDDLVNIEFFRMLLSVIDAKKLDEINYTSCMNAKKSIAALQRIKPDYKNAKLQQKDVNEYFSIKIDNQVIIKGFPQIMKILDNQTYIQKMELYISVF